MTSRTVFPWQALHRSWIKSAALAAFSVLCSTEVGLKFGPFFMIILPLDTFFSMSFAFLVFLPINPMVPTLSRKKVYQGNESFAA
jgi:hypothetical protein